MLVREWAPCAAVVADWEFRESTTTTRDCYMHVSPFPMVGKQFQLASNYKKEINIQVCESSASRVANVGAGWAQLYARATGSDVDC